MSNDRTVRIIPLGGLGEIGLNMMVVEAPDEIVVIDAGLMFPDEEMLGIDLVIPDISYLLARREKVRAVLLTHGHEDHTGALPYLLAELKVPVYGTPLSLGLAGEKLKEAGLLSAYARLHGPKGSRLVRGCIPSLSVILAQARI